LNVHYHFSMERRQEITYYYYSVDKYIIAF
jgi:hypothetical protein